VSNNTTDPLIGRLIDGRYQVRSRIARGGMATVYLATDLRLDRRVALKIMHSHLAEDSKFKERFIQEARSAARLGHPNVVNVFDQGQDSDMAYLVMEYLPGITLRDLLQEHKVLTTEQAMDIMEAVLSGLAAAHKAGIVHRDLKPENVLLADDGRIKIGDFGLARAASANTATGAALLGTIAYLSPELVTRGIADARSDIYAVGIMLYEMLAGEQPFRGEQPLQIAYQHANDTVPTPSTKNPRVPVELDELVLWATARDPDQRPRDAGAMLEQLSETQNLLRAGDPTGATATQRTMVMPLARAGTPIASTGRSGSTAETQVFAARSRPRTGPVFGDNTAALATKAEKRHRKGFWLFGLVILLAALAGGTGWYFGSGPGSKVMIPAVSGQNVASATTDLTKLGLIVSTTTTTAYSTEIASGLVVGTMPKAGSPVVHGGTVALVLSKGPQPVAVPKFVGMTEAAADQAIKDAKFTAQTPQTQFSATIAKDIVLAALGANNLDLSTVSLYGEKQPVTLVVSLGSIPDVAGKTVGQAQGILQAVGLTGVEGSHSYSDTVAKGNVIRAQLQKGAGPATKGSTVDLVISDGVEQVQVPDVKGMVWSQAKNKLTSLGFKLNYDHRADILPDFVLVKNTNPQGGTMVDKGSTVAVNFQGGGGN
jgi:beta-lactam-binding protein with PASTA domain/tRNA A-37 threonylcarbamoyl transferase component Bud32